MSIFQLRPYILLRSYCSIYDLIPEPLVHYEKRTASYEALIHLACAIICWRKIKAVSIVYG